MFTSTPRYIGFPNQVWIEDSFAFKNFETMFKNKIPYYVSTFRFKDKETPIVNNLFFDIDSYFGVRIPWRNVNSIKKWCYKNDIPTITNFSVTGDREILVRINNNISLKPISEVVQKVKEGNIIEVLSYNKEGNVTFSTVYDYLEHEETVYEITHEQSTFPLKLTEHHSIYKWDNSEIIKVEKNQLHEGDFLVTYRNADIEPLHETIIKQKYTYRNQEYEEDISITDGLLRLMGYYVAEGHTLPNGLIGFSFHKNERAYHQEVRTEIKKLIPAQPSTKTEMNIRETLNNDNEKVIIFSSKKYRAFFREQCGTTQEFRHVPSFLFGLSKEQFLIFLTAYLNGDGSYKQNYDVRAKSISRQLIVELCWLCKIHGISCTIFSEDRIDKRPEFKTKIVYIISLNKRDLYERQVNNKYHPDTREKVIPIDALKQVYYQCKPKKFQQHRVEQVTLNKQRANHQRIINVIKWFDETKSIEYTDESRKIIANYKQLIKKCNIGFLKVKKISNTSQEKVKVYDVSVIDAENFFCGPYPILHSNSGGKGFHCFILTKPVIPKTQQEKDKLQNMMYSVQMAIAKETKIEAYDEPTFARLRFLMRYPTSRYIRKDKETGDIINNGLYCCNLTDEVFDGGCKKIGKVAKEPGVIPKTPKSDFTLKDIADRLPNFRYIKRENNNTNIKEHIYLQRNGMHVPPVEALGLPCLIDIVKHSHPTHFERIELVAWMKYLGYTDIVINSFIKQRQWTRYRYNITNYQISTVFPRMVKCSFLRNSYGDLCKDCVFGGKRHTNGD